MLKSCLVLGMVLALAAPAAAEAPTRTERVKFAPGAASAVLKGSIRERDGVDYLVGARAGQTLAVSMKTSNPSAYFNIWAPGASEALFVGSTSGASHTFKVPSSGDYRVQVYLMRNAARRNETAAYALTISAR